MVQDSKDGFRIWVHARSEVTISGKNQLTKELNTNGDVTKKKKGGLISLEVLQTVDEQIYRYIKIVPEFWILEI